ncbi:hypothetical protein Rsub_07896 [Raphidocelis subcapitata]|uniref:Queuosine 5'-phosphate N-glycosylase/hydrolase n=1 Tax=Raphidocelis subcapitata TaxID=307507 RepID=A0A2V0PBA9_9CHLO|nr:hypothetical protein Rsub_07896 [Raphidocelis subcapitata]|eukprot:GBF95183.1 hypothetical protein Rsub_07896 [Raphidocelis subcapitata]
MPGVPSVLEELHSACAAATAAGGDVTIDADAAAALAARLEPGEVRAAAKGGFPIKFDTLEAELTFLALYHLLDFGGEFDDQLRAAVGRDARETMQFGALGLHLGAKRLDRHFLKDFSAFSVSNYFGFEGRVDSELQPGITISKPGPLQPLAEAVRAAVNGAGAALEREGQRTLGGHILAFADARRQAGEPALAAAFVADLAAAFPGYDDVAAVGATRLPFHRKAQALAADLCARFGTPSQQAGDGGEGEEGEPRQPGGGDARFAWEDAARLAGDSGSHAAAAWHELGVVRLPEALAAAVKEGLPLTGDDEARVRAAAVAAADAVAAAAGGAVTAAQLGAWAAGQLEEGGQLRGKVKGHVAPGTTAY